MTRIGFVQQRWEEFHLPRWVCFFRFVHTVTIYLSKPARAVSAVRFLLWNASLVHCFLVLGAIYFCVASLVLCIVSYIAQACYRSGASTLYKFVTFSISVGLLFWVYSSSTKMSMILSVSILLNCSRARIAVVNSSRVTCEKNHRTKRVKTLQQTFPFWSSSISAKVLEVMNSFEAWESNHGHCLSDISSVKSSFDIVFVEDFVGTTQYQMFYASLSFNPKLKS